MYFQSYDRDVEYFYWLERVYCCCPHRYSGYWRPCCRSRSHWFDRWEASAALCLLIDGANATDTATTNANAAIYSNPSALDQAKFSSNGYTSALRDQIQMQYTAACATGPGSHFFQNMA